MNGFENGLVWCGRLSFWRQQSGAEEPQRYHCAHPI